MLAHTQLSLLITQIRTGSILPLARCARVSCLTDSALPAPPPPPGPPLPGPPLEPTGAPAGLIDIGANLLDSMFQGEYRGKQAHPPDLQAVLERAAAHGCWHVREQSSCGESHNLVPQIDITGVIACSIPKVTQHMDRI